MPAKVTLKDVAKEAGVSPAVVSRVVNNASNVKPETYRSVMQVIERLNYTPDSRGRGTNGPVKGKRQRKTNRIALVGLGMKSSSGSGSPVYADLINALEHELSQKGKSCILKRAPLGIDLDVILKTDTFDGIILIGTPSNDNVIQIIRKHPCVQVMGQIGEVNYWDHVSYDNAAVGRLAAKCLLEKGHRCCGLACYQKKQGLFQERYDTFMTTIQNAGGKVIDIPLIEAENLWRIDLDKIGEELAEMTAVFSVADVITTYLYNLVSERGIIPGKDLEFVSCNNEWQRIESLLRKPNEIDLNVNQIARRAVQQLLWRIDHPRHPRERVLIDVKLVSAEDLNRKARISL